MKLKLLITTFCLLLTSLLLSLMSVTPIKAQADSIKLTVSPPTAYIKVRPGSKAIHTITVENNGSETIQIKPKLVDFYPDDKTGKPRLKQTLSFPYFNLPQGELETLKLEPGQKAEISLVINPDKEAVRKEWPVTILFQAKLLNHLKTNSQVSGVVGSNLVIFVSGKEQPPKDLIVKSIGIPSVVDSFRPIRFNFLVTNPNDHAVVATGSAVIRNLQGKTVENFQFFPTTILGKSSRLLKNLGFDDKDQPKPIEFNSKKHFWLGYYTVQININNQSPQEKSFLALPIFLLILVLIGVSIFIATLFLRRWGLRSS